MTPIKCSKKTRQEMGHVGQAWPAAEGPSVVQRPREGVRDASGGARHQQPAWRRCTGVTVAQSAAGYQAAVGGRAGEPGEDLGD